MRAGKQLLRTLSYPEGTEAMQEALFRELPNRDHLVNLKREGSLKIELTVNTLQGVSVPVDDVIIVTQDDGSRVKHLFEFSAGVAIAEIETQETVSIFLFESGYFLDIFDFYEKVDPSKLFIG